MCLFLDVCLCGGVWLPAVWCSPRINQAILSALIVGSIFFQTTDSAFASKFSMFFMIIVQAFFFNMVSGSTRGRCLFTCTVLVLVHRARCEWVP